MVVPVIGYAYGNAAGNPGCEDGPHALQLSEFIENSPVSLEWSSFLATDDQKQGDAALTSVRKLCLQLADFTLNQILTQQRFLVFGGDHSSAIGTWSGAATALTGQGGLGLIWFDAHMDSHTVHTTPSHNIHGMPLAVLLGHGEPELIDLMSPAPKLLPQNAVLIGVRSYESGEAKLLQNLGVKIYFMDEVEQKGMQQVMQEAIALVSHTSSGFGISIDLDGIDPNDAPGVGSPEQAGVHADDFLLSLTQLPHQPKFIGAEIAEFNPNLDKDKKTEKIASDIITVLFE